MDRDRLMDCQGSQMFLVLQRLEETRAKAGVYVALSELVAGFARRANIAATANLVALPGSPQREGKPGGPGDLKTAGGSPPYNS